MPWVEQFWHTHKRYPSDAELMHHFKWTREELDIVHASKFYMHCLKDRGINFKAGAFTELQQAALTIISNIHDTKPNNVKLAAIGVTPAMYHGWMQDPAFNSELQRRFEDTLDNIYPDAQAALARQIKSGHFGALKFYFEMTGRASSPEVVNVRLMMNRVIEAVQKHVTDPEVLQAIAAEIHQAQAASVAQVQQLPSARSPLK